MPRPVILFLPLFLLPAFTGCNPAPSAANSEQRGIDALDDDPQAAVDHFTTWIEHSPRNVEAYEWRAVAYSKLQQHHLAARDFSAAIRFTPDELERTDLRLRRGCAYREAGAHRDAIRDFDKVLFDRPNDAVAHRFRGFAHFDCGDLHEALADLTKAIDLAPNFDEPVRVRGQVYQQLNRYEEAVADFDRAIEINDRVPLNYLRRGEYYYRRRLWSLAIADFRHAIRLDDEFAFAWYDLAYSYHQQGNRTAAIESFEQAIALRPDVHGWRTQLAQWHFQDGNFAAYVACYDDLIEADPEVVNYWLERGWGRHQSGETAAALADFRHAQQLDPSDPLAFRLEGRLHADRRDWEQAAAAYDQAIALFPDHLVTVSNRAAVAYELADYNTCEERTRRAVELAQSLDRHAFQQSPFNAGLAWAHFLRARLAADRGDTATALVELHDTLAYGEDPAMLLAERAAILHQLGLPAAAALDEFRALKLTGLPASTATACD